VGGNIFDRGNDYGIGPFIRTIVFCDMVDRFKFASCYITLLNGCNDMMPSIQGFVHWPQRRMMSVDDGLVIDNWP
jgi:hypothetical protein